MTYTVLYKKNNGLLWRKLSKVKGDGFVEGIPSGSNQATLEVSNKIRYFILEDESRIEIPAENHLFKFSKERFLSIKIAMEQESGLNIKTR